MKRHWPHHHQGDPNHQGGPTKWRRKMYYFFFVRFILFTAFTTWGIIALVSWLSRLIVEGGISARITAVFLLVFLFYALTRLLHGTIGPISRIMTAIDQVAEGDLSTRINLHRGR